jgi:hypothetical protein
MKRIEILMFLLFVLDFSGACSFSLEKRNQKQFVLYDAMFFKNKPNLEKEGLKPIILLYEGTLTMTDPSNPKKVILDPEKISFQAKQASKRPEVVVSTDIEQWYGDGSVSAEEMSNRFKALFETFRRENPNVKIGNYGVAPSNLCVYRFYDKNKTSNDALISKWKESNKKRFASIEHSDIIFPSVYMAEPDIKSWKQDLITTISEIKRYNKDKPVILYLWPAYYDAPWSEYNRLIMDSKIWKEMLEISFEYADGAVIWASNLDKNKNVIFWTDPRVQKIWEETQKFIKAHKLY